MMNNNPKNIDVSFLKNKTLIQIAMGENEIVLKLQGDAFDDGAITIESAVGIDRKGEGLQIFDDIKPTHIAASAMADFLSKDIKEALYKDDGSLTLTFESGGSILLFNNEKDYVSYAIHYKNNSILI